MEIPREVEYTSLEESKGLLSLEQENVSGELIGVYRGQRLG